MERKKSVFCGDRGIMQVSRLKNLHVFAALKMLNLATKSSATQVALQLRHHCAQQ